MKLNQYKEKKKSKKMIIIAVLLVIGGIIMGMGSVNFKNYTNFNYDKSEDIIYAFYNGEQKLDGMPKKGNKENLGFEKAICNNGATVEWNKEKWAPLVVGLNKKKTKCNLYFTERKIDLGDNISVALADDKEDGLYDVDHYDITQIDNSWKKTEYRYAGVNPKNYIEFNSELWRIIGLVNVKTKTKVEQRLKIIRTNGISGQKDLGNYSWDRNTDYTNNWTTSKLKEMLNGIYYNSNSGECYKGNGNDATKTTCDFSGNGSLPKGLSEEARKMIDSEVIWNIGGTTDSNITVETFYEKERGISTGNTNTYPNEWTKENDAAYHNGIGLMYPSDYGYASHGGAMGRESCFNETLNSWRTGNYNTDCAKNDWLKPSSGYYWILLPYSNNLNATFYLDSNGFISYSQYGASYANSILPVVYLTTTSIIYDGDGSLENPFKLKSTI